jgi:DNA-binding response OmpR family regulator
MVRLYCATVAGAALPTMANRFRLLIIDDSPVALSFLQAVFKSASYDVDTAPDGETGFVKAQSGVPDLIVTDGLMPGIDGFELIRRLRADPATKDIPVLMLTSGEVGDAEFTSRVPQPDAMVAKSSSVEPVLAGVKALLSGRVPRHG